jgi:hypothetical protein
MSSKTNLTNIAIAMVVIYVGGILGGLVLSNVPLGINNAWVSAFLIALVQAVLLSLIGLLSGKMGITTIIITAVILVLGGLIGGFVAGYLQFTDYIQLIIILLIQTLLLSFTGYLQGGKSKVKLS